MTGALQALARLRAGGSSPAEIEEELGLDAETVRLLSSSDAFKALEREEVIRLRGGDE